MFFLFCEKYQMFCEVIFAKVKYYSLSTRYRCLYVSWKENIYKLYIITLNEQQNICNHCYKYSYTTA